jgi:hypothetical protein
MMTGDEESCLTQYFKKLTLMASRPLRLVEIISRILLLPFDPFVH